MRSIVSLGRLPMRASQGTTWFISSRKISLRVFLGKRDKAECDLIHAASSLTSKRHWC